MSQLITIQVGQCGNQIGGALWPLILQEYGIVNNANGFKQNIHSSLDSFFYIPNGSTQNINSFEDFKTNKIRARAILIDMEDKVIAKLTSGPLKHLFDPKFIVTNYSGSGNNWAEGHCCHGPKYETIILNVIRNMVDLCDSLQGFFILLSAGGGTGSGLGTFVLKLLQENYPHVDRFVVCVYPTGTEDVITCPYNMLLATNQLLQYASCVFPVENRALLDIVSRQWNNKHSEETANFLINCTPFQDMNSIIVNMILHLTSGSRFSGNLNVDMNEINTNMVPFPKMQFLASAYSPFTVCASKNHRKSNKQIKEDLFLSVCSRNNELLKINSTGIQSILMGCTLVGRGDFTVSDMRSYIHKLQTKSKFTNWSKKAMKIGLCDTAPKGHNAAMLGLFNTTSMSDLFLTINNYFNKLYQKKAHIHHYQQVDGFDDSYFEDSQEAVLSCIKSYEEIVNYKPILIDRLHPYE